MCGSLSQDKNRYKNSDGDGVGQLKRYCLNWGDKLSENTIPILTNGKKWIFFKKNEFIESPYEKVTKDMVKSELDITNANDIKELIEKLKLIKDDSNSTT